LFLDFNSEFDFEFLVFVFEEEDGRRDFTVLAADLRVGWAAVRRRIRHRCDLDLTYLSVMATPLSFVSAALGQINGNG
jgi:hypothetical protein